MKKLTVHTFEHHRFWQEMLILSILVIILFSIERYFFDFAVSDTQTWLLVEWLFHILTIGTAIKVAFFSINPKEVKSYYYSSSCLNLMINNLHTEEEPVQDRMLLPLVMKMVEEPDEYRSVLNNINSPWALQLISNFCLKEMEILERKLGDELRGDVKHRATPHSTFKKILSSSEIIQRLEEIQIYCSDKAP